MMFVLGLLFMQSVEYVECNQEYMIFSNEENTYNIDIFNVVFYEENGKMEVCKYLSEAGIIEIEEEKYVPNAYYIYLDGKLLQEIIVEEGLGKQNIHYIGYLHNFEMNETHVMSEYRKENNENRSIYILGFLFLFLLLSLGSILVTKV